MDQSLVQSLFFVLTAALIGGVAVRVLRLPSLIGYILAGVVGSILFPSRFGNIEELASLGIILLLFSVGLELSLSKLGRVGIVAVAGSVIQMAVVMVLSFMVLGLLGFASSTALVFAAAFSLSSTAVVVKMLSDRGEMDTLHGEIMVGWLLVQDLAVIPMVVLLPALTAPLGQLGIVAGSSLLSAFIVVAGVFFLGKLVAPFITHFLASNNSRELMVVAGVAMALGTAGLVSLFGISAALGAFLAGVVISETQENHAIFSETRPLRDLFVILFFVSLGFLVNPEVLLAHIGLIGGLAFFVMLVKFVVVFIIATLFGYRGKTAVAVSMGLTQIGEFSFVLFLSARELGIVDGAMTSVGIATTLVTILLTPLVFKSMVPFWRWLRDVTTGKGINKYFVGWYKTLGGDALAKKHIIICGFGRMGSWIGKALEDIKQPYVVIDFNQKVVRDLRKSGIPVIYGDPAESEVLEEANVKDAKSVVVAIPDSIVQEEIIAYTQTVNPNAKIYARAHRDEDVRKLGELKVKKVVQPEFEGALAVVRDILASVGKSKEEITLRIKGLRTAHANTR